MPEKKWSTRSTWAFAREGETLNPSWTISCRTLLGPHFSRRYNIFYWNSRFMCILRTKNMFCYEWICKNWKIKAWFSWTCSEKWSIVDLIMRYFAYIDSCRRCGLLASVYHYIRMFKLTNLNPTSFLLEFILQ